MRKKLYNIQLKTAVFILPLLIGFATLLKANTYVVTNTSHDGNGSLKQAIQRANAHAGADKIIFNLPKGLKPHVIQAGREELRVSDELIIDGFEGKTLSQNDANGNKTVKIFLDTEGGIFSMKNITFKGIGLEKNNPLKIQKGARFIFENCIFMNEIALDKPYTEGVFVNDDTNLKNCLIENDPADNPKLEGNTLRKFIRQFSNIMKVSGFDFSKFVQKNVDLSLINKSITNCNVLKLYTDTISNNFDTRVLYRLTPKVDSVPPSSNVLNIIISEHAVIVAQPNDISECVDGNQQMTIAISGGTGNITYQWQISTDGMSFNNVPGATGTTFTPSSTTVSTTYYRVVISSDVDGCGPITSTAATVAILADPSVFITAVKDIICEGETATLNANITGGLSSTTIQWQNSTDGTNWSDVSGATNVNLTTGSLSVATQYRVVARQGSGCETTSAPLTIQMGSCNGTIGDFVWLDCNKNGIQEPTEIGIGGVTVTLRGTTTSGEPVNKTVVTDNNGQYRFTGIRPGKYYILFSYPSTMTGLAVTLKDQNNDVVDSDIFPDGKTEEFIFGGNQISNDFDAGFIDVGAPTVTAASELTVSCDGAGNQTELNNWLLNHAGATAIDNMSTNIIWTNDYTALTKTCGGGAESKVTFTATDECGNSSTTSAFFKIKDDQPPVFSNKPTDLKLKCGDVVPALVAPSVSDVCGSSPVISFAEKREDLCGSSYKIVRTWTATDGCGNSTSATQTVSLDDNEPPRFVSVPSALSLTCNQLIPPGTGVIAVDNCDGNPRVTMSDLIERGVCGSNYKINRLWTAIDACGNFAKATQVITVGDYDAPQITGVPADISFTCGSSIASPSKNVKATDNCSSSVRLSVNDKITRGACPDNYSVARTWTATDVCGNVTVKTQKITIKDDVNPELVSVPADVTVKLYLGQKVPVKANVVATDNCDSRVDVNFVETKVNNLCGYTLKRTWTALDNCQNRDEKTQIITVRNAENNAKVLSVTPENCNEKNGRAEMSPSTGGYTYAWSDGKTGYLRTDLAVGTYKVTATSSVNCSIEIDVVIKRECDCDRPVVSVSKQDWTCAVESGTADISVANGLPADLKYIWTPNVSTSNKGTNLPAGNYTVRVERANKPSCYTDINFKINGNSYVTIQEPAILPAACNASTGKIAFTVPANDTLKFKWSDGVSTASARSGLASGSYTVTISRPNSSACPLIKTIEVKSNSLLNATHVINRQPSCGLPNGAVTINTTGGSGNYTYSWGEGNSRYVLSAGAVNVTVTDVQSGCFTVVSFVLTNQSPEANIAMDTIFKVSCPGMSDGRAVFNVTFGSGFALPAKYEIRDYNNVLYANGALSVGNYYILMVKDSSGCLASSVKFKVIDPSAIVPSFTKTNETCDSLGSINVKVTGGTGGYKFTWADLGNQPDQTPYRDNLKAGFYSVTIADAAGCQKLIRNVQVKDSCACRPAVVESISMVSSNCNGSNGSAAIILRGGTESNYTYTWSPAGGTVNVIGNAKTGLAPGIYNVTITSKNTLSCITIVKVAVGATEGPTGVSAQSASATCDAADGSVTLTANEPVTYLWVFDGKTVSSRNDLKTGVYQVMVARASALTCATALMVRVESQSNLTAFATINQKATCGSANGIATIRVTGGSGKYRFSWGLDSVKRDVRAGVYIVTVTDITTNCKLPVTFSMTDEMDAAASITISNPIVYLNCAGNKNGYVNYKIIYGSGFAFPSKVYITDGNGRVIGNDSLPKGNYCIVVKDAKDCMAGSQCFEVKEPAPITVVYTKYNKTCVQGGSINLTTIRGGSGYYQYAWSDKSGLSQTFDRTGLQMGTYSVTIYDSKGCSYAIDTIKIASDCPTEQNFCTTLVASATTTNKSCTEGGKILVSVSGGTAPYSFDWADLALTNNPQNRYSLDSGSYSIIITDAAGCKTTIDKISIKNTCNNALSCTPPAVGDITVTDASCSKSTGQIVVNVLRPTNAIYKWSPNVSTTNTAKNLLAGVYKLKICNADDTTCFTEKEIIVKNQNGIAVGQPTITSATCGASNGKVEFPSTGKVLNYTWSDGKSGSIRSDLAKGSYTLTVTDPSGISCAQFVTVDVPAVNSLQAVGIIDKRSVCGQATGQATMRVLGGSGSYSYSWGSSATKTNLKAGVYNVIVTDNQTGCVATVTVIMTDDVSAYATVSVSQPLVYLACAGENNGSVVYNISYASGFAMPSKIVIADNLGRTAKNDNLAAGRYAIFVYDNNNCLAGMGNFEIREPQMLIVNTSVAPQMCASKGSITLNISGGSGVYTYKWADLTGTNQAKNRTDLFAGDYYLTVTDSRGCNKVTKITVQNEALNCTGVCDLQVTASTFVKTCTEGGKINLTILNGSGVYGFLWSDLGTVAAQPQNRTGLNSGIFSVTIIDSTTNCKVKLTNIIIENKAINCPVVKCGIIANVDVKHKTCTEGGIMRTTVYTGYKPYKFDWLDLPGTDNPQNRFNLLAGQYTLIITDSLGCKDTLLNIVVKDSCLTTCAVPSIVNLSVTEASCFGNNGSVTISMSGTTNFIYKWLPKVSTSNIATGLAAGIYKVRIARAEDTLCFIDKDILVNSKNDNIVLSAPTVTNATCGASNGAITVNGQTTLTYKWNDGVIGKTRNSLAPNTYYVTVTDPSVSGCPVIQEIVVKAVDGIQATARIDRKPTCGASNGQVTISVTGGSGNFNYSWGTAVRSNLKAGNYNVWVSDNQTGCSGVVSVNLVDDVAAAATIKITTTNFSLNCKGDINGKINYTVAYANGFAQPSTVKIVDEFGNTVVNGQLKVGKYKILAYDANGCMTGVAPFEMTEPDMITAQASVKAAECNTPGAITLTVSGGAGSYIYDWADLVGTNDARDRTAVSPNLYSVTIKDANGCFTTVKNIAVANNCSTAKPKRDSVYRTVIVNKSDTACVPIDAAFVGQTLNYVFCNGSLSMTTGKGVASLGTNGCVAYKASTSTGRDELCVRTCNVNGVCDTTIFFFDVIPDPLACQTSYLGTTTVSVAQCDSLATICTNIPYRQLNNYTVIDNNLPTQFYTTGCKQDTFYSYSYYALTKFYPTGPWDLASWTLDGVLYKAKIQTLQGMVDSMNKWDTRGNWILDVSNQTIIGGSNSRIYGNMDWKRSGRNVASLQKNTQIMPAVLSLRLKVGSHKIVFTDKLRACKDSTVINVLCNVPVIKVGSYVIDTIIYVNKKDTICFNNAPWASQSTIKNVCTASYKGYAGYAIDDNTDCIRLVGASSGRDTLCLRRCYIDGHCDTIKMYILVKPYLTASDAACIKPYTGLNYYNVPCGTQAKLCTNLQAADTLNYVVTLNGTRFTKGFYGCTADTSYAYNYYALILSNPRGAWKLGSWIVNGNTYTGVIPSITALVDSMNKWDIGGNWRLETTTYSIKGGKSGNNYGNMVWYKNNTTTKIATFGPNRQINIKQIGMQLDTGRHRIIFKNLLRGCSDTVNVQVECRQLRTRPTMTIKDTTVYVNETSKYCLPTNGVLASNTSIATVCNVKGYINFVVDDKSDCVSITGASVGRDTICLQRCDFDGECDTVKIAVNVLKRTAITTETVFHSIKVGKDSTYCVKTNELSGKRFIVKNICEPNTSNNVNFIINGLCVTYMADNQGIDTACLVVSDEFGNSDTTRLIVYVIQERQALPTPIAIRDRATTAKGTQVIIKPMDNDSIFGLPSNIIVLTQPTNGQLSFDPATNNVVYSPTKATDCINRDSFRYAVVNAGGKDTAEVAVEILCDEIVVFSGFSPNGDGVNDNFTILGLEKYPNNKIFIFNQRGNQVFTADNYQNNWNGISDGLAVPDGTYFWILDLGNGKKQSGYVQIHR